MRQQLTEWKQRSQHLLTEGGAKLAELDTLLSDAEQFMWGSTDVELVQQLLEGLRDAKSWVSKVNSFSRSKPTVNSLRPVLQRNPVPCSMPAYLKLAEAY